MQRIAVVGTTGSGKTWLATRLAERLGVPHVELDALYWGPNWTPKPTEEFRALVDRASLESRWVIEGNYHPVRDLVWKRADTLVWLNYSFPVVFFRAFRRTLVRCLTRKKLYAGNRESLIDVFFTRESILLWVLQTYWKRRKEYPALLQEPEWSHLEVIEINNTKDAEHFLKSIPFEVEK